MQKTKPFGQEIEKYSELIIKNHHLAVTGVAKIGIRRVFDLLIERLKEEFEIILVDESFDFGNFREIKVKFDKPILLVVYDFSSSTSEFKHNFQKILLGQRSNLHTLIAIDTPIFLELEKTFDLTTKPITNIEILKPRKLSDIDSFMDDFEDSDIPKKIYETIFKLAGGIPGLMKRCVNVYNAKHRLTIDDMLNDYATILNLQAIAQEMGRLSNKQKIEFGLVDKGIIKSQLLRKYLEIDSEDVKNTTEELLQLFLKNENRFISIEDIDSLISEKGTFSLWNRYKQIERVRGKLPSKYTLKSIRGRGYQLSKIKTQ